MVGETQVYKHDTETLSVPSDDVQVLIVDDRDDNLEVLAALLEQPGLHLLKAASGTEALELLLEHDVALALIDVQMPAMDGFELAELMRGTERTRTVPIIFVTAATPQSVRVFRGYEAGAVDFLFKPIDSQLLRSKVGTFIELFRQRQQLGAQVEEHKKLLHTAELLIGVLSHDLRAPLSAIVAASEILPAEYPGDDRIGQIAHRIGSSSKRMTRLINQLLDFATARVGQLPIRPQPTNLAELSEAALAEFQERGGGLQSQVCGDPVGTWDPDRLLQVLSNLIGNAVQHGDSDSAVIVRIDGANRGDVQILVESTGVIPEEIRARLFTPFVSGESPSGGTGLGLYIVDQITRAHGGEASVATAVDKTIFAVTLPRHYGGRSSRNDG
jgi:two-component system, sensor histidine kinase and response regulator